MWDFGDGDTSSVQHPSHVYTTEGLYSVQLVSINSFGSDTVAKPDYIEVLQIPEELSVSPVFLDFDSVSTEKYIDINNIGGGLLTWTLTEEISWLTTDIQSGETTSETDQIIITVDRTDLSPGDYTGIITISSNGGTQEININMNLKADEEPKPPGWGN
ncbi:PKD domain-containing protein [uncultured Draconibacterium sp.]|uniref:PKD domain-containing protein n=1 Tax=uncultured Draconibacterium sp. TaxID=1573823 RepID=UPI002AA82077|nr:PKD domain-containing protein [uncultured Draconibacterium sp.]